MSSPTTWLLALAWSLVHAVWQGAAIAAALAAARFALRHSSAESRHLACCLALFSLPVAWLGTLACLLAVPARALPMASAMGSSLPDWAPWLVATWSVGLGGFSLRTAAGLWRLHRLSSLAADVDAAWASTFSRLRERSGVRRLVRLATSTRIDLPMTLGWLRPVVLLPPCLLTGLPPAAVEALLLHELLHVRRRDWLVSVTQSAVEALLFHVPATWWISACLREERELCCDSEAAAVFRDRLGYARALTELEQLRHAPMTDRLAPSATGGSFVTRIRLLLEPETAAPAVDRRGFSLALAPLALALLVWSVVQLEATAAVPSSGVEPWRPTLEAAAQRHGVDSDLLAAMAQVESGGDPDAESSSGALGLMQVMPATAARIAAQRGLPRPDADLLRDPDYNVDTAAWFLARQLESFADAEDPDAGVDRAIAAYNAGAPRVRQWMAGRRELPRETQRYLGRVRASWPRSSEALRWSAERLPSMLTRHPLPQGRSTSSFGPRRHPESGAFRLHRGLDLAAPRGLPVRAAGAGKVRHAEDGGDDGLVVVLDHGDGLETRYHHLDELKVREGQRVEAGETLGTVGSTGRSTGPHLHLELRRDGEPIDPEPHLPKLIQEL